MNPAANANGPRAVAPATEAKVVHFAQGTPLDSPSSIGNATRPEPDDFPLGVIWSAEVRGELVQFSVNEMNGSRFADLRRFYLSNDEWLPGRKGCTIPLSGLYDLHANLGRYLSGDMALPVEQAA